MANYIDILLVSEASLKASSSYIDSNIDGNLLLSAIKFAQDSQIQPNIGNKLMLKLKKLVNMEELNNQENIDYKNLVTDYIHPIIENAVLAQLVVPISFKIRNIGVNQNYEQQSTPMYLNDIKYYKQSWDDKKDFYLNRMIEFLRNNSTLFPELPNCIGTSTQYTTNLYLGDIPIRKNSCK